MQTLMRKGKISYSIFEVNLNSVRLHTTFSKDKQMVCKYMQRHLIKSVFREMQIKTTKRYHRTLTRMANKGTIIENNKC